MSPQGPTRAARTASVAVFLVFALVGVVFATWASRLPATRDALGITPGQMGLLLLVGSAGSIVALPLTGSVVHRFGTAPTTRAGILLTTVGLVCAAAAVTAGSTTLAAAALFLTMVGIGGWDVAMNLQGTVVERHVDRAIMPRFHAGFSLGAVAGAAIGALAAAAAVSLAWHLVTVVTVCAAAALALTRAYLPDGELTTTDGHDPALPGAGRRALTAWTEPRTLLIGLMVLAAALTEGSANDWLALAVVDDFDSSQAAGAITFGIFVAAMTIMRFAGTRLLDRYGRVPILRLCAGLALAGLALFGLAPSLPLALVAVVLWGFGAALGFPVGISAASDDPAHSAARVSVVSSIGYVAFLAGPPVLGLLADHVGYRNALLTIAIPLVASFLLSPIAAPLPVGAGQALEQDEPAAGAGQREPECR